MGEIGASVMSDYNRLDIGKIKIFPESKILGGSIELNIFKAEIRGRIKTNVGELCFIAYTPRTSDLNIIEIEYADTYHIKYVPGLPSSPRFVVFPERKEKMNYTDNPQPILSSYGTDEGSCLYKLNAGGDYAVYWKKVKQDAQKSYICVSAVNETPLSGVSLTKAKETVESVDVTNIAMIKEEMHHWWERYWEKSCINIPDKQMENFYNIQMYKLAVNSTPEGPAMDCLGVLYKTTQWPGLWWNLNVQLTYMSTLTTNRDEQSENYIKLMDEYFLRLIQTQDLAKIGDYAWALHTYYSILKYRGTNWSEIKEKFLPKALAVAEKYQSTLVMKNGIYHLMQTESPEYEGFKKYDNSNYNLALFNWLISAIKEVCLYSDTQLQELDSLSMIKDKLHSYPEDQNGLMIASDKPLSKSHRHYSHLLSFYPLKLQNMQDEDTRKLLLKSLEHWLNIENGKALAGYSFTGAASLYALLGDGDNAYKQLRAFLNSPIGISILLPNTMYVETNGKNPVIETPLSAATAISELLLQNVNNTIIPFPAIPRSWKSYCSFKNLRTEGGFIVSAEMADSELKWVKIHSLSGMPCTIKLEGWNNVYCLDNKEKDIDRLENGCFSIRLKKGEEIVLSENEGCTTTWKYPGKSDKSYYGVKKGKGLPMLMDW